jgi:hypothetical protein
MKLGKKVKITKEVQALYPKLRKSVFLTRKKFLPDGEIIFDDSVVVQIQKKRVQLFNHEYQFVN